MQPEKLDNDQYRAGYHEHAALAYKIHGGQMGRDEIGQEAVTTHNQSLSSYEQYCMNLALTTDDEKSSKLTIQEQLISQHYPSISNQAQDEPQDQRPAQLAKMVSEGTHKQECDSEKIPDDSKPEDTDRGSEPTAESYTERPLNSSEGLVSVFLEAQPAVPESPSDQTQQITNDCMSVDGKPAGQDYTATVSHSFPTDDVKVAPTDFVPSTVFSCKRTGTLNRSKTADPTEPAGCRDIDVMMGRGGKSNKHPGNLNFHKRKEELKSVYVNSKKKEKRKIAEKLVHRMEAEGRRFMEYASGEWREVSDKKKIDKASQALRS